MCFRVLRARVVSRSRRKRQLLWCKMAYMRLGHGSRIRAAVDAGIADCGTTFVEVRTDHSEYMALRRVAAEAAWAAPEV